MAKEVELKLTLPSQAVAQFINDSDIGVSQGEPLQLDNQYFDTPERALNQAHAALRVRKSQHGYKQTLKNKGQAIAGLHQRGEWEYDIPSAQLDWSLFASDIQLDENLKQAIQPIFKTDFTRHVWIKQFGESEIEVVLDEGLIHTGVQSGSSLPDHCISLCEIELELKTGKVEDIFEFALQLAKRHPLVPCDINKAERGYGLLLPAVSFFTAQNFAQGWQQKHLPVFGFLQESLTRISRHWDQFTQQENWWSLQVIGRQVHTVCWLLSHIPNCKDELRGRWLVLQQDLVKLMQPAIVVTALYVDNNSNSRGLSQRLLNIVSAQLAHGLQQWMNHNGLGIAMLELGQYLYDQSQASGEETNAYPWFEQLMGQVSQEQFVCEGSLHALANVCKRCDDERYSLLNDVIRCSTVVQGMIAAKDNIQAITDETSRAKLASWQRRLTVENRNLLDAKHALTDAGVV